MRLLGVMPSPRPVETVIHRMFADIRVKRRGEWYLDTGDRIVDTLGKILMCVVPP